MSDPQPLPNDNPMLDLLLTRRSAKAIDMTPPGPTSAESELILRAGHRVPDHGKLGPWRFILFEGEARSQFGEILRRVATDNEPNADEKKLTFEADRFTRAPLVVAVVSKVEPGKIPEWEQVLSAGAVCQNMLVAAHALGYAAQWLTEWYAYDGEVGAAMGLEPGERVAGFIYIGTRTSAPDERPRPDLAQRISRWQPK